MTEITRAPLQPIAKGALSKLWLGVAAALLLAGGVAWAAMPAAVKVETIVEGKGLSPTRDDVALINYKGMLTDGKVFDGVTSVAPETLSRLTSGSVYVKADARAPFQRVLTVLEALRGKRIALLTAPPPKAPPATILPPYGIRLSVPE